MKRRLVAAALIVALIKLTACASDVLSPSEPRHITPPAHDVSDSTCRFGYLIASGRSC